VAGEVARRRALGMRTCIDSAIWSATDCLLALKVSRSSRCGVMSDEVEDGRWIAAHFSCVFMDPLAAAWSGASGRGSAYQS